VRKLALVAALAALPSLCARAPESERIATAPPAASSALAPALAETPRVEAVPVEGDLDAFAVRGVRRHALSVVFLSGLCTHPGGYLSAFPWTAVEHGDAIAVQGDVPCGGAFRKWSYDVAKTDRRIGAAFRAAGLDEPSEVTLIGYSQGADIAERLAARFPAKYTRLVLIASPVDANPAHLRHARAVLFGIGERESHARAKAGVAAMAAADVPTAWFVFPGARHGSLGPDAQRVMGDALAWLENPAEKSGNGTIRSDDGHDSAVQPMIPR
jgi:pimeloyl-ACP methyl ester carboxylesterase